MIIASITVIIIIGVLRPQSYIADIFWGQQEQEETEIWAKWGMLMEIPAGLEPKYSGFYDKEAKTSSGVVSWKWDKNLLTVSWHAGPPPPGVEWSKVWWEELEAREEVTGLQKIDSGQVSIQGHTWHYESIAFKMDGTQYYSINVSSFYEEGGMQYNIMYSSPELDPLEKMMRFGSTFRTW